jgi:valyl-tRNA synthetase
VEYVCPHCGKTTDQAVALKAETQARKSRGEKAGQKIQPADCHRVKCSQCGKDFATQWANDGLKQEFGLARETSEKFEIGRNFCNKLWNAARYAFMNLQDTPCEKLDISALYPEDRWILTCLSQTIRRTHASLSRYQFSATVKELREFFWEALCDWYIELTKPRLAGKADAKAAATAKQVLAFCMDQVLRLWHPIIPFITERLWQQLNEIAPDRGLPGIVDLKTDTLLIEAEFPPAEGYPALEDANIIKVFGEIQDVVRGVRDLRSRCNVSPRQPVNVTVVLPESGRNAFEAQSHIVLSTANVEELIVDPNARRPANAGSVTIRSLRVFVHDISDDEAERKRTTKAIEDLERQIKGKQSKLSNEKFVSNAPSDLVEAERGRLEQLQSQLDSLQAHLCELNE